MENINKILNNRTEIIYEHILFRIAFTFTLDEFAFTHLITQLKNCEVIFFIIFIQLDTCIPLFTLP